MPSTLLDDVTVSASKNEQPRVWRFAMGLRQAAHLSSPPMVGQEIAGFQSPEAHHEDGREGIPVRLALDCVHSGRDAF
jgi:hypothetical protein